MLLSPSADLRVPADHRVDLAFAGGLGQIIAVLLQCLEGAFRVRGAHARTAAHGLQRVAESVRGRTVRGEQLGYLTAGSGKGEQQMLGADVLVGPVPGVPLGSAQHGQGGAAGRRCGHGRSAGRRQLVDEPLRLRAQGDRVYAQRLQQRSGERLTVVEQGDGQVRGLDGGVAAFGGRFHRR